MCLPDCFSTSAVANVVEIVDVHSIPFGVLTSVHALFDRVRRETGNYVRKAMCSSERGSGWTGCLYQNLYFGCELLISILIARDQSSQGPLPCKHRKTK